MLKLLADENFKRQIVVGLRRRISTVDITTVQDLGLTGSPDPKVLATAASEDRVLLTHDVRTLPAFAYERLEAEDPLPGVIVVPDRMAIGLAIDELILLLEAGTDGDLAMQVLFLPL